MSRKRALKKRADYRGGGYVSRKKYNTGGVYSDTPFEMNKKYNLEISLEQLPQGYAAALLDEAKYGTDEYAQIYSMIDRNAAAGSGGIQTYASDYFDKSISNYIGGKDLTPGIEKEPTGASVPTSEVSVPTYEASDTPDNEYSVAVDNNNNALQASASSNNINSIVDNNNNALYAVGGPTRTVQTPSAPEVVKTDPQFQTGTAEQIAARGPTTDPEDIAAQQITAAQGQVGQAQQQAPITAAQMTAAQAQDLAATQAAQGIVTKEAAAVGPTLTERAAAAQRDAAQEQVALVQDPELQVSPDAFIGALTGQVATVVQTTEAEQKEREATIGMPSPNAQEAQIINEFGFGSSKNRVLRGPEAKQAAADRLVAEHGIAQDVAENILEDVGELVTNVDGISQESLGAVASLPREALVSSQMESLLAGMETGETPTWARPAVEAVENKMVERGLSISSVGRDSLFNAIIQSALPIAQSNAQALQQRATQNLSNEQQALIQDRQISADFLVKNAGFKQQMDLANLSNDQQMRLANLSAQNLASSENLSASQQTELANLNSQMQSNLLQAKLAQEMGVVQLNVDQQTAIRNASMVANIDFTKYTTAQQNALANSKFMQSMTMADFNANQQSAMQNATTLASMDLATADQNTKLSITNAQNFLQMDMTNLSNAQQASIMDQQLMQQRFLSNQAAENAARQFNSASENQTNQFMANLAQQIETFNSTQLNTMNQFNTSETNRNRAINAQNELDAQKFNNQIKSQIRMFDSELDFKTSQWNSQNAQAVEQSNIAWRRQANTIDTAAQNAANQQAAQMTFNMSQAEQDFLWQRLRDEAGYAQLRGENKKERAMQTLSALYGNTELMTDKRDSYARDTVSRNLEDILEFNQ